MEHLRQTDRLIKKAKLKFIVFSLVGILLVILISLVAYQYHSHVVSRQASIESFYRTLVRQSTLVHEIASLGEKFNEKLDERALKRLKIRFHLLVEKLSFELRYLSEWRDSVDPGSFDDIGEMISKEGFEMKLFEYIRAANELSSNQPKSFSDTLKNIRYLSTTAHSGLADVFERLSKKVEEQHTTSLKNLDRMGLLFISLCFLEVLLVWSLVFKPLYSTLIAQHERLAEAVLQAESANRSKTDFLANISHEIRTPMTAILGYAEILGKKNLLTPEESLEGISVVNRNAAHLLSLVDEILDMSKIEAGRMALDPEMFDLNDFLNETYSMIQVKSKEKGIDLVFEGKGSLPAKIHTDRKRLKQILFNILGNAIKFTDRGFVKMIVSFERRNNKNYLIFMVKDSGRGIAKEKFPKLFTPFSQIDTSVGRRHGGTGLGLVLSRGIAREMGGEISLLESALNQGTAFEIRIDCGKDCHKSQGGTVTTGQITALPESHGDLPKQLHGVKVLIVDDAKENARLFKIYLTDVGAEVDIAHDGETALAMVEGKSYDIILLDLQMPVKDGYQVFKELRAKDVKQPIVALTAHAMSEQRARTHAAGFNGHISKPVKSREFIEIVAKYVDASRMQM